MLKPSVTMQIPDVNVLVHAWRRESAEHDAARNWLEQAAATDLGLLDVVATGVLRVLTLRVPGLGASTADVLANIDTLRAASGTTIVKPNTRRWTIFTDLCRELGAAGNAIPDCYIAAAAIEQGATLVSRDIFFSTIPGLDWIDLPGA